MSQAQHRVRPGTCRQAAVVAVVAVWLALATIVAANGQIGQNFDGPDSIWHLTPGPGRILGQTHVRDAARNATPCERVVVAAPVANSVQLECSIPRIAVLDELEVRLWVKASRPDIRLAARVTMPRSVDSQGRLATTVVLGARYNRPGHWQQLVLNGMTALLAGEVRVMRARPGTKVDPREAYLDSVVLVVPGEPNGIELYTDDLEVDGVPLSATSAVQSTAVSVSPVPPPIVPVGYAETSGEAASRHSAELSPVRMQGPILLVAGKPLMPRAIEWRNEPFKFLADLGFNTILLPSTPTAEQVAEAARYSLWFVCSPPRAQTLLDDGIPQPTDRVIAWYLDDEAIETDPEYGRSWAESVRRHDAAAGRPILMTPQAEWSAANSTADIVAAGHPRASWISRSDYDEWLESRVRLTRPSVAVWTSLPTQLGDMASLQSSALAGTLSSAPNVDGDQLEMLVRIACMRGSRGIIFRSSSAIDEETSQARRRAALLERTNRWLQLIEPWIAGGKVAGRVTSSDGDWTGIVLHVDTARLVLPFSTRAFRSSDAPSLGALPRPAIDAAECVFVVPGVPESSQVFWLSPAQFRPLAVHRVAGGIRIAFPADEDGMLLVTEDPRVVQGFRLRVARDAARAARLERDLAGERARQIGAVAESLAQLGIRRDIGSPDLASATAQLKQCDQLLTAGRADAAYRLAESANERLMRAEVLQRSAVSADTIFLSHSLALSAEQLLAYAKYVRSSATQRGGENLLYGGDFEDIGQLTQFGWAHVTREIPGVQTSVRLSTSQPQHGQFCLEMSASPNSTAATPDVIDSPSVWIVSPAIPVTEGQVIEITCWVRVDQPIAGSVDGLTVVDSLGGEELSLAVRKTSGWQALRMLRAVPESTELRLTFALSGLGSAFVDGAMVRTLAQPTLRRLPAISSADRTAGSGSSMSDGSDSGPLFVAPGPR